MQRSTSSSTTHNVICQPETISFIRLMANLDKMRSKQSPRFKQREVKDSRAGENKETGLQHVQVDIFGVFFFCYGFARIENNSLKREL